jgi:hypothetical protein
MQCDNSINEGCEMLGSFELLEQVINSVFGELGVSFSDRIFIPDVSMSVHHSLRRAAYRSITGRSTAGQFTHAKFRLSAVRIGMVVLETIQRQEEECDEYPGS